jgi:hypothetical protein
MSVSNDITFVSLSPYLQYFGEDCRALAVTLGVGMNLVPILVTKKARIGTLCRSDFSRVLDFLSQDESWLQRRGSFTDESVVKDAYANEDCRRTLSRHFDDIGLNEDVLCLVYRHGWEYATKIQMQSLQIILAYQSGIVPSLLFST